MNNSLETIEERERRLAAARAESQRTWIACPHCGTELVDGCPGHLLLTNPPQRTVLCPNCRWSGMVTA
jgi:hypothetical protein